MIESFVIVGSGRAARALGPFLQSHGLTPIGVAGRSLERAGPLAHRLNVEAVPISETPLTADLTMICVLDTAVAEVCAAMCGERDATGTIVAHMAGALSLEPLSAAIRRGAGAGKLHPVASVAGGRARLRNIAWGIGGDDRVLVELRSLVETLGGIPVELTRVNARMYHLAAVLASNFTLALMAVATEVWEKSGAPLPAHEALLPLVRGTLDNWSEIGLEAALTGPIQRGDVPAVERQLQLIQDEVPHLETIYRALAAASLDLAERADPGFDAQPIARAIRPDR